MRCRSMIALTMTAAAAAVIMAGCTGSRTHAQSIPSASSDPPTPASSTPSPSRSPLSAAQKAGAQAAARVAVYERTLDDLFLHPRLSIDKLYTVSTQPDVNEDIGDVNRFRAAGDRQTGRVQLSATRVDHVNLTNRPHARHPVYPTVTLTTCIKVNGVHAHGANGKSIVPRSRKPYLLAHLTLVNFKYPDPTQWLVRQVTDTEEPSCGA